jgi:hypothetical protein
MTRRRSDFGAVARLRSGKYRAQHRAPAPVRRIEAASEVGDSPATHERLTSRSSPARKKGRKPR